MRRKDREIIREELKSVIEKCETVNVGLIDCDKPYVVTMNFGLEEIDAAFRFYFHCAVEGRKLDVIRANSSAFIAMDTSNRLVRSIHACEYTMEFESIMAPGNIRIVEDETERRHGLELIMSHYEKGTQFKFDERHLRAIKILRFDCDEISGKRHIVKKTTTLTE